MYAQIIRRYLEDHDGLELQVRLHCADLTAGETEWVYFIEGQIREFPSIYAFVGQALQVIDNHMAGRESDVIRKTELAALEVDSCEPESWMHCFNPMVQTDGWIARLNLRDIGYVPPLNLVERLYVAPHFCGVESCLVAENSDVFVLYYWYTTG